MIETTIQNYFEGYQKADSGLISKAFHKDVSLLSSSNGKLEVTKMSDWLAGLDKRKTAGDIREGKLSIESIDQTHESASVKLRIQFEKFEFVDYLSLLKLENKWVIVGKIYHYQDRLL